MIKNNQEYESVKNNCFSKIGDIFYLFFKRIIIELKK